MASAASAKFSLIGDKAFYKKVFSVTIPIMVQNLITSFVSLLDNIMVGQMGTEQMSGVAIANQLVFVFNLAIFGAISGVGIFTAQFFGSGDEEGVRYTMRAKLYICLILLGIFWVLAFLKGEMLIGLFLRAGDDQAAVALTLSEGKRYLMVILIGLLPFAVNQVFASTLRESGETVLPMKAGIIAVFVNLVFNYILIFGHFGAPALGVVGAAVATVLSRFVEVGIVAGTAMVRKHKYPFLKGLFSSFKVPGNLVRRMFRRGTPLLLNEFLWSLAMSAIMQSYSTRGLAAVAALNINSTVVNLFAQGYFAMGSAVAIIVGQLLGAGKYEEARQTDYKLIAFGVAVSVVIGAAAALLAPLFPRLYNTSQEVRDLAASLLRIAACFMPLTAFCHTCYFTLRSGGKTIMTFFFDSFYVMVLVYPISFLLSRYTGLPMQSLYACVCAVDLIKATVGFILVRKGVWINNIISEID